MCTCLEAGDKEEYSDTKPQYPRGHHRSFKLSLVDCPHVRVTTDKDEECGKQSPIDSEEIFQGTPPRLECSKWRNAYTIYYIIFILKVNIIKAELNNEAQSFN